MYLLLWLVLISPQFWVAYTTAVKTVTCDPRIFRADKRWERQFGTSTWLEQDNPGQSFFLVLDKNKQIVHDLNLLRYMPLTWPLGHIGTAVSKPEEDKDIPKPSATPYLTLVVPFTLFLL